MNLDCVDQTTTAKLFTLKEWSARNLIGLSHSYLGIGVLLARERNKNFADILY